MLRRPLTIHKNEMSQTLSSPYNAGSEFSMNCQLLIILGLFQSDTYASDPAYHPAIILSCNTEACNCISCNDATLGLCKSVLLYQHCIFVNLQRKIHAMIELLPSTEMCMVSADISCGLDIVLKNVQWSQNLMFFRSPRRSLRR